MKATKPDRLPVGILVVTAAIVVAPVDILAAASHSLVLMLQQQNLTGSLIVLRMSPFNPCTGCSEILVIFGNARILKPYNLRQSLIAQFIQN